jgi:hypothetical protein
MTEIAHIYGNDLSFSPAGDLAVVDGTEEGRQRVIRRVLTEPGNYIWDTQYGGGVPAMIGTAILTRRIEAAVRSQMFREQAVSQIPPPVVKVTQPYINTVQIDVKYQDAATGDPVLLGVSLTP